MITPSVTTGSGVVDVTIAISSSFRGEGFLFVTYTNNGGACQKSVRVHVLVPRTSVGDPVAITPARDDICNADAIEVPGYLTAGISLRTNGEVKIF